MSRSLTFSLLLAPLTLLMGCEAHLSAQLPIAGGGRLLVETTDAGDLRDAAVAQDIAATTHLAGVCAAADLQLRKVVLPNGATELTCVERGSSAYGSRYGYTSSLSESATSRRPGGMYRGALRECRDNFPCSEMRFDERVPGDTYGEFLLAFRPASTSTPVPIYTVHGAEDFVEVFVPELGGIVPAALDGTFTFVGREEVKVFLLVPEHEVDASTGLPLYRIRLSGSFPAHEGAEGRNFLNMF